MAKLRDLGDWDLDKPGGRLGFARQSRGLGRAAIAPLMPINPRTLEAIEKGWTASVPYELARLYAVACDVSVDWLVFGTSADVPDLPRTVPRQTLTATAPSQGLWLRRKLKGAGPRASWPRCRADKEPAEPGGNDSPGSVSVGQHGETPTADAL